MWSRPVRTLLTVASIIIGVAATVAVSIVTATTRESYETLFSAVQGRAALDVAAVSSASIPEELVPEVAAVDGVAAAVPIVQQLSAMTVGEQRVRLRVMGIDTERDSAVRNLRATAGRMLGPEDREEDNVMLEAEFARQLGINAGDTIRLLTRRRFRGERFGPVDMNVVGLVEFANASTQPELGLVFMTLERAQARYLGPGLIDVIQVVPEQNADVERLQERIQQILPEGIEARPPRASNLLEGTLKSSQQGLTLTTAFSLLLAGFIILNTFLMNIGERRRHLAIMRVVGATRQQIVWGILRESLGLGALGTLLGIGLGLVTAWLLTDLLARILDVALPSATQFMTSPWPYVLALLFGFILSTAGAVLPAVRAGRVSPLEGMSWVTRSDIAGAPRKYLYVGLIVFTISAIVIAAGIAGYISIDIPTYGAVGLLIGVVLIVPFILKPLASLAAWPARWIYRVEADLALKQILRHQGRTALTVGVLFIAGSTGVGMAHSILDNVRDVEEWYRKALIGDYYVRAMLPDVSTGMSADLPEDVGPELEAVDGIAYLDRVKLVEVQLSRPQDLPGKAEFPELTAIVVAREYNEPGELPLDLVSGDLNQLREQMAAGQAVIGTILANKMNLSAGDTVEVATQDGKRSIRIAAVTNDYLVGGQTVYLEWNNAKELFGFQGVDGFIIRAERDKLLEIRPELEQITRRYGVLLHSSADIGRQIDRIVLGIDGFLWGLVALGFVVAAFGVVNTLSMNVLEQTRELGVLRMIAMTKRQVRRTILTQAMIIGLVGLLPGVLAGLAVAYVINLAMEPSFGRPIEFNLHPWMMLSSFVGAMIITLIAAYIPAERAARINVVEALHYE